jgi:hypothetical protein
MVSLGHVDAVTAFGGDKAFTAFRESEQVSGAHTAAVVMRQDSPQLCPSYPVAKLRHI